MSQDPTEENFGRHRTARRRYEHPSLYQFGYDSNMIRMSSIVVPVTGNSKGAPTKKDEIMTTFIYLQVSLLILLMFVPDVCSCGKSYIGRLQTDFFKATHLLGCY